MATTTKIQATASKYGNSGNSAYTNNGSIYVAKLSGGSEYRTRLAFPAIRSLAAIGDANVVITKATLHMRRSDGGPALVTAGSSADGAWGAVTDGSGSLEIAAKTAWYEIDITDCAEEILNYPGTWYLHLTGTGTRVRCSGVGTDWTPYINVVWEYSANTLTTDAESVELGKSVTLNIAKEANDARFELSYSFGDESGTIADTAQTSAAWTPPVQLATEIPNSESGEVKITMRVYDASGKQLRTEVLYLTVTVPATIVPAITDAGISLVNGLGGYGLTGKSYAAIAPVINIGGAYGATVKSIRATVTTGGSTQDIVWSSITEMDAGVFKGASQNTSTFKNAGNAVITLIVTDSRGREVTHTHTISVQAYANPVITQFAIERYEPVYNEDEQISGYAPSDVGENVWVTLKASCTDVQALNKITWKLTAKASDGSTSTFNGGGTGTNINLIDDRTVITAVVSAAAAVEYTVEVEDTAGYVAFQYDSIMPGRVNFGLAGSKYGASFGCLPKGTGEKPMLESAYPFHAYGGIADFGGSVQSGMIYEIDGIDGGAYLDTVVAFEKSFSAPPAVVCCIYSDSVSAKYGLITATVLLDTVTTTGFTVRCYNGDSSKRYPRIKWMAIGAPKFVNPGMAAHAYGNPISFRAIADSIILPETAFEPKQSGSGTPSITNIRPISGWDALQLNHTGENLVDRDDCIDGYELSASSGAATAASGWYVTDYLPVTAGHSYRNVNFDSQLVCFYDADKNFLTSKRATVVDAPANAAFARLNNSMAAAGGPIFFDNSNLTPYAVQIGQTVYGGRLDWNTGKLIVEYGYAELTGNEQVVVYESSFLGNGAIIYNVLPDAEYRASGVSSHAIVREYLDHENKITIGNNTRNIYWMTILDTLGNISTDEFKAWLAAQKAAGTPVQIAYRLGTPTEIQLTALEILALNPTQINTLYGDGSRINASYYTFGDTSDGDDVVPAGALMDSAGYSLRDSSDAVLVAADPEGTVRLSYTGAQIDTAIGRANTLYGAYEDGEFTVNVQSIVAEVLAQVKEADKKKYPIGYMWISTSSTNPADILGFGTWERVKDTFLLAAGDTYAAGSTGGSATHTHKYKTGARVYYGMVTGNDADAHMAYDYTSGAWIPAVKDDGQSSLPVKANAAAQASTKEASPYFMASEAQVESKSNMPPHLAVYVFQRTA